MKLKIEQRSGDVSTEISPVSSASEGVDGDGDVGMRGDGRSPSQGETNQDSQATPPVQVQALSHNQTPERAAQLQPQPAQPQLPTAPASDTEMRGHRSSESGTEPPSESRDYRTTSEQAAKVTRPTSPQPQSIVVQAPARESRRSRGMTLETTIRSSPRKPVDRGDVAADGGKENEPKLTRRRRGNTQERGFLEAQEKGGVGMTA